MVITAQREIDAALEAAQCVVQTHHRLVDYLRAGRTLAEIDRFVAETLHDLDCRSAFLGYRMKGHPPMPPNAVSKRVTPCRSASTTLASPSPRVSCR